MQSELLRSRQLIDRNFPELMKALAWHPDAIEDAQYVLVGAGKALRPALTFWAYKQFCLAGDEPPRFVVDWATALEMIHTYSLVHDDLPAMDNDAFRRGKPTLHTLHGDARAILAGDALLTGAFEVMALSKTTDGQKVQAISLLARAAGAAGMISGQIRDMFEKSAATPEANLIALERVHNEKTGALIAVALEMGAIAANASEPLRAQLKDWGLKLGLLFQVIDDILDVTESSEKLGKSSGKDAASGKRTYVSLLGVEGARQCANKLKAELIKGSDLFSDSTAAKNLVDFFFQRKS